MTDIYVKKFKGSQGSCWEAEVTYSVGSREVLACVHKYFFKRDAEGLYYSDPFTAELLQTTKFAKHADLIRSKGRVILTTDAVNESGGRGRRFFQALRLRGGLSYQQISQLTVMG